MKRAILPALSLLAFGASGSPCSGVDRTLTEVQVAQLAPVVADQLGAESVELLQSYHYRRWYIIYVSTHVTDEAFLFFDGDPLQRKYVTRWSGGASNSEGPVIEQWVRQNAKGIPLKLASCFAWHVTKDRDR